MARVGSRFLRPVTATLQFPLKDHSPDPILGGHRKRRCPVYGSVSVHLIFDGPWLGPLAEGLTFGLRLVQIFYRRPVACPKVACNGTIREGRRPSSAAGLRRLNPSDGEVAERDSMRFSIGAKLGAMASGVIVGLCSFSGGWMLPLVARRPERQESSHSPTRR